MKEHQDSGGPAFPLPDRYNNAGMTLRDYFAAQALNGMLARQADQGFPPYEFAKDAYAFADAMLAAREEEE